MAPSADGLAPYPSPELVTAHTLSAARAAGGEVVCIGTSVEGRDLLAVRLSGENASDPAVLCTANIHGPEYFSTVLALALLDALAMGSPARRSLARAHLWVIPSLNPDAYARTWSRGGRGALADLRTNARGVDLNRNYPLPPGERRLSLPGAGSDRPGRATYRGPAPLSEPESAALARICDEERFHASINLHTFMGTVIPAHTRDPADFATYRRLHRMMAAAQPWRRYRRLAARVFDGFTGEQEDFQHHVHHTWAVCFESFSVAASFTQHLRAPSLFWRFNPRDPAPWIANDVPALLAFWRAALGTPRPGPRTS